MRGPPPMDSYSTPEFPFASAPRSRCAGLHPRFNVGRQELSYDHLHDPVVCLTIQSQIYVDCFKPVLQSYRFPREYIWRFRPQCRKVLATTAHFDTFLYRFCRHLEMEIVVSINPRGVTISPCLWRPCLWLDLCGSAVRVFNSVLTSSFDGRSRVLISGRTDVLRDHG
jgi:hypothetical protein